MSRRAVYRGAISAADLIRRATVHRVDLLKSKYVGCKSVHTLELFRVLHVTHESVLSRSGKTRFLNKK